jgi:hypothetical protein
VEITDRDRAAFVNSPVNCSLLVERLLEIG